MKGRRIAALVVGAGLVFAPLRVPAKILFAKMDRNIRRVLTGCSITSDGRLRLSKGNEVKHLKSNILNIDVETKGTRLTLNDAITFECNDERSIFVFGNGKVLVMKGFDEVFNPPPNDGKLRISDYRSGIELAQEEGRVNSAHINGKVVFMLTNGGILHRLDISEGKTEKVDTEIEGEGKIKREHRGWLIVETEKSDMWIKWGSLIKFITAYSSFVDEKHTYLLTKDGVLNKIDVDGEISGRYELEVKSGKIKRKFGRLIVIEGKDDKGKFELMVDLNDEKMKVMRIPK